jgi:hypothetical protein
METHFECIPPERAIHQLDLPGAIVVVEDPFIQQYLRHVLVRHGYRVVRSDARSLKDMLRAGTERVNLAITNAPQDFLSFAGSLPLVYTAGAPDLELASRFSYCRVLKKPFQPEHLLTAVRELTAPV